MNEKTKSGKKIFYIFIFIVTVIVVFILGLLAASIFERRGESVARLEPVREIAEWEPRNEIWGENYPRQYESYRKTLDTGFRSKYAGSATIDYLEDSPDLVVLWAGYLFSRDFKQARGHAYAIRDIRQTLRTGGIEFSPQPGTCWSCKSTDVPRLIKSMGAKAFYKSKWSDLGDQVVNPIGCQDCHDPKTMDLRITRPALIEALERRGKKISDITHQEMRSLVCAQCHVEYYFKGPEKYLTFPWDKGFSADSMESYYNEIAFKDWEHKLSKAPMLKAQHPDYELFMTGIHATRGVSCADCHMPYKVVGGVKFTDHHIQSPLNNIANSCQVCHRQSETQLLKDVYERQDRVTEIRKIAEYSLRKAHLEAELAWKNSASEDEMKPVLELLRSAQWRWDWVAAANSVGFHSPVEALRVLGTAIERSEKARGLLNVVFTKKGMSLPVTLPDVSTKLIAQKYIGLDLEKILQDKLNFLQTVVPEWDKKARSRQGSLEEY